MLFKTETSINSKIDHKSTRWSISATTKKTHSYFIWHKLAQDRSTILL